MPEEKEDKKTPQKGTEGEKASEEKPKPEEKKVGAGTVKKAKKEKKSRKDRAISKKKHSKVQIWKKYQVSEGKVVRKGKACPRCGMGTFLAEADNRVYCGKCGYAEIKKK